MHTDHIDHHQNPGLHDGSGRRLHFTVVCM